MGLGIKKFYATNTADESKNIFLSGWKPIKKENGYCWPPNTALGADMWIPNVLDLKEEEGTVEVEIIKSETETGLWMACEDDYFIGEQWLYTFKPIFKEDGKRIDWTKLEEDETIDEFNSIHVRTDIDTETGDVIPVTLKRKL